MKEWPLVSAKDAITSLAVDRGVQEMIDLIRFWHRHNVLDLDGIMNIVVLSESYDDALCFVGGSESDPFFGNSEIIAHVVIE